MGDEMMTTEECNDKPTGTQAMTDEELIRRMRYETGSKVNYHEQAADRIEKLVIEVDEAHEGAMSCLEMWGDALVAQRETEAKLAKAITALRFYAARGMVSPEFDDQINEDGGDHSRATLKELGK